MSGFSAQAVHDFLIGLGATADEVAASVRELGVTGRRNCAPDCPIVRALRAQFPDALWVGVSPNVWLVGHPDGDCRGHLPEGVRAFVHAVDVNEAYPDLVDAH